MVSGVCARGWWRKGSSRGVCILDLPRAVCPCLSSLLAMLRVYSHPSLLLCKDPSSDPHGWQICVHTGLAGAGVQLELGLGVI